MSMGIAHSLFRLSRVARIDARFQSSAHPGMAVIYAPDFALQAALRIEPESRKRAVALLDETVPGKLAVLQMTEAARYAGVLEGQTSTQAMARCREIILKTRSRPLEEAAAETLWQCAYGFAPSIEATADGVCTMDLQGLPITGDGWEEWALKIHRTLQTLGLEAQIGLAETPHLAWQAAQRARPVLRVGNAAEFVGSLPVNALGASPEMRDILQAWGIRTIGAFLALGKNKIAERLGVEGVELFDLASTPATRPLKLIVPKETFEEAMDFEQPVELIEPLLFVLRRFVEQLARRLEVIYLVAGEIKLQLALSSGAVYERLFVVPAPTRDVETLFRMLQTHLENVRTDAPILSLRLSAKPARPAQYQFGLFEVALRDPNQFHETLARLTAFLGNGQVGTPRLQETYRPDGFQMEVDGIANGAASDDPLELLDESPKGPDGLVLRRFRPPIPAIVELRHDQPALVHSAYLRGPIREASGPWRLSGDWWDAAGWAREEWDVQTGDGELLRLVRQDDQWFLDGIFD